MKDIVVEVEIMRDYRVDSNQDIIQLTQHIKIVDAFSHGFSVIDAVDLSDMDRYVEAVRLDDVGCLLYRLTDMVTKKPCDWRRARKRGPLRGGSARVKGDHRNALP